MRDKPAIRAKFQMSGLIPKAAIKAMSEKCHELPFTCFRTTATMRDKAVVQFSFRQIP
jgi:hypothetical protein